MIRILYRHRSGAIVDNLTGDQLAGALKDPHAHLWIDLLAATPEEYKLVLEETFHFHPLAVEDAINDLHVPKLDDYGAYLYLVFHSLRLGEERMDIETRETDVFLGQNYLITVHDHQSTTIDKLWNVEYHQERGLARGPALLLYELLDKQIDGYMPLLDQFEARIEELGDLLFLQQRRDDSALLNEILTAKSSALRLRRILLPQREVLAQLARDDLNVIPAESRIYFQDVYDHILRLEDLADSMRDLVTGTMTIHLTLTSNRLNEIMKVLTIISTIFMPLSFIAGNYGMNFVYFPELNWPWGYAFAWFLFISVASAMLLWFRHRRWI
jgi:magnesium transporter